MTMDETQKVLAFSCVGRWRVDEDTVEMSEPTRGHGCNYAGGGLFQINPVRVVDGDVTHQLFEWAEVGA